MILIIDVDVSGNVINVMVEKFSCNCDLDCVVMEVVCKWCFNVVEVGGKKMVGCVCVLVNFVLN